MFKVVDRRYIILLLIWRYKYDITKESFFIESNFRHLEKETSNISNKTSINIPFLKVC